MDETNYFRYLFNSFLVIVPECVDNPASDNSGGFGNDDTT